MDNALERATSAGAKAYLAPMPNLSPDDAEIDALWREVSGQPPPMLGAPEIARKILEDHLAQSR